MVGRQSPPAIDLSEYLLESIHEDGEFVVCRGSRAPGSQHPGRVLVVMPRAEHPRAECLQMLEHEHALRHDVDADCAVRPVALVHHRGRLCLVLDDPGGELLARRLGPQPMELGLFLRLSVGLSAALGALHRRGIIHKDLTPGHVLIDEATGRVWLTGFRLASRLQREREVPQPAQMIAGTLPYMAPEQTGRLNRSIDSRTDLYALGVILYEMLTGALPFSASDPMEWVHCHLARQPVPPSVRVANVPRAVAAIVVQLLAKAAEQRYQTASGVERDLRRCLMQWEAEHRIDEFPLGEHDTPDRLLIPDRLYGREREIETLVAAFDRVVNTGLPELVLVSGYSGIGKSSLVNELHKALVPRRGLFASGKFDQYKRDIPYATLAQAFQGLVRGLLVQSDAQLTVWRAAFEDALGANARLMVNLVPELAMIIGEQPPAASLPLQEARRHVQVLFERFIRVFARPEHPLALFVDDLQWLDTATLELLEYLLTHTDVRNLLVIGAYRDNEVDSNHPLTRTLHAIRDGGAVVHEIGLAPLTRQDVGRLVAEALHSEPERVAALAELVCEKTAGNPFFITQLLTALREEGLLAFDHAHVGWSWDLDRVRAKRYTDNVADLMFGRLARLAPLTQRALQALACLGDSAAATTLAAVLGTSVDELHAELWDAVRAQLVEHVGDSYRFLHDRLQEAAYSLVPEGERSREHLRIGRILFAHAPPERREERIFDIVDQLNRGATVITSADERQHVSRLHLIAGKRAKASAAYAAALRYFASGAALLPDDAWDRCPELTFGLEFGRGECEFLIGDLRSAEERLSRVAARTTDLSEEASVTAVRLALYTVLRRRDRAIEIGLSYLAKVGIALSAHPADREVVEEHERLWRVLGERPIESLFELPPMPDPRMRATIEVLIELQGPAYWTDQNLEHLLRLRTANLSIEHGSHDSSAVAYAYVGPVLGARFGEYVEGYRFGRLGLDLVDKKGLDRGKIRVYVTVATLVVPWVRHVREARSLLRRAMAGAAAWRPLDYYMMLFYSSLLTNDLASGEPLAEVLHEAEEAGRRLTTRDAAGAVVDLMTGQRGLVRTLRGLTPVFGSFGDDEVDDQLLTRHLESEPELARPACLFLIRKLQAYVYAAEYDRAAAMAARTQPFLWATTADILEAEYHFHAALARAAIAGTASPDERRGLLAQVVGHHQRLLQWAGTCPANFEDRAALVGAEVARLVGRELEAERLYEHAIAAARVNGFVNIEALANELAGRFYRGRGFETIASAYLEEARRCYVRWGADGKVRQLDRLFPLLDAEERLPTSHPTISQHIDHLELATVLKALQAISGELVLERLIDTLLRMAIEHAGAARGVLLVTDGNALMTQAEANISESGVNVHFRVRPLSPNDVAETVVQYVTRTQETVILDDAGTSDRFSTDVHIRQVHPRSILCLPLVKQGRLVAVLYLENHLTPAVFTPARIAVLQVLAPQAAMSLENSRLYRELELREAKIRQLVDANIVGVAITTVDGAIIDANDAALDIVGYAREDVRAGRVGWRELTPPEWQEASHRAVAQLQATGRFDVYEKELLRSDGSRIPVLVAGAAVDDARHEVVTFVIDLTERKRAERERDRLRQLQADLAHVNRISMMGELTASLAHELKQPITAAMTDARTCLRWLSRVEPDVGRARKAIARVLNSGTRATDIIDHLRSFYRKDPAQYQPVDANELVREMLVLLRSEAAQNAVSMLTNLPVGPCMVTADPVQLQQVLMNLMLNALEAMRGSGGELTVSAHVAQDGQLTVSVGDTGVGLPVEAAEQIFTPFFSTKPQGTGMGLSISRSIVESHGGRLWATPNTDRGATFHFTLPAELLSPSVAGTADQG